MSIGENLRKAMDDKGITAYRISKDLGISPSTVANYLNDSTKPDATKLQNICQYIGIPIILEYNMAMSYSKAALMMAAA